MRTKIQAPPGEPDIFEVYGRYKKAVLCADVLAPLGIRAAHIAKLNSEVWKQVALLAELPKPPSETTIAVVKEVLEQRESLRQKVRAARDLNRESR